MNKGSLSALIMSTLAMIASFTVWVVMTPVVSHLDEVLQLSTIEKSVLVATPVLLGSIMRIPMGILTDRYGGKKIYTGTMLFLAFPLVAAGFVHSYHLLLLVAFFIGFAGTTFAIAITFVSKWFPSEKQGLALGIVGLGNFGTAIASFSLPSIINVVGVSWTFWGLALMMIAMAAIFWFGTSEYSSSKNVATLKSALSVTKHKETWLLSLYYFLTFGGFVAFSVYLPTLLQDIFNLTPVEAGIKTAGFITIATFIRPVGGYLGDRLGSEKILTAIFVGTAICSLIIAFSIDHFILFSVGCLLVAFLFGIGNGAIFKLVPQISSGNTGAVTGVVGAVGGVGGFFPPIMLGIVMDLTGTYFLGFLFLSCFAVVCFIAHQLFIRSTQKEKTYKTEQQGA
ncbi:nitrate/nitrite transporter [Alkalihalobacillus sp. BA299]|uniref:MFS transporter n=1 Tax=Alkalihalobacillus sp. BA299 TaxID=2815938 RepID=UPI001ADD29A6|nr:MFS transporter [Alkalihalobacillus sp. BA299]